MSIKNIKKEIKELKRNKTDKNKKPPFSTLEKFKSGELTGEEALAILEDGNEPFAEIQTIIIKSAIYNDEQKRENTTQ